MTLVVRSIAAFWICCVSGMSAAQQNTPLTLSEALARVLETNPQLQAADFDTRAAAERIRQQSQSKPYELTVELENLAGSGDAERVRGVETTLGLGRVIERGDKLPRRREVAQLEAGLLRHDRDAERLDLLAETARRFLTLAHAQAGRELAERHVELMRRSLETVQRRQRAGKAPAAESNRAQIGLARAQLALEETEHLLANGRRQLAVLWGDFEPDFERVRADIFRLQAMLDFPELERMIERNPALARLATRARLSEARLLLARSRSRSDLHLFGGVRHFNETDDIGLVMSLRLPLGTAGRSRPYIEEAEALAARQPLVAQNKYLTLRATLFELYQELVHARDRFEAYQKRVIPAADAALDAYRHGYAAGRYSLLELSEARNTLLESRVAVLSAANDHHAARIEIERLVGVIPSQGVNP